jgi:DNA (cytosine-5)-methyltransferase 1
MFRAIREIQPSWIVGENVRGLTNWNGGMVFNKVQANLESEGYQVTPFLLPACGVNAPHKRERIWFVAYNATNSKRFGLDFRFSNRQIQREEKKEEGTWHKPSISFKTICNRFKPNWDNFPTVSPICSRDDGISDRLDSITFSKWRNESIKAGGNAIVPQVVHQIFKAIEQYEITRHTQGTQAQ